MLSYYRSIPGVVKKRPQKKLVRVPIPQAKNGSQDLQNNEF